MTTWFVVDVASSENTERTEVVHISSDYGDIYGKFLEYHDRISQKGLKPDFPSSHREHFHYHMGEKHRVEIFSSSN